MNISTSHQISRYYDYFRDKEIVFTKANLKSLKIDPRQIYIKCNGGQWPCIINSSSLQMAKIIIGTASGAFQEITKKKDNSLSLRYCFLDQNNAPIHFFVNCNIGEISRYQNTEELALVTLVFTQRPPDDLISRIGEFVEACENFKIRKEERISINSKSIQKLGIDKEESVILVEQVPRRCVLKDISFGGAKVMLVGIPKFLVNKSVVLKIEFSDTNESLGIAGKIMNAEFLEGRKDISLCHIVYDTDLVPMSYKIHVNNFITTVQKSMLNAANQNRISTNDSVINANVALKRAASQIQQATNVQQAAREQVANVAATKNMAVPEAQGAGTPSQGNVQTASTEQKQAQPADGQTQTSVQNQQGSASSVVANNTAASNAVNGSAQNIQPAGN
ncbi:MAG: PilZ domain-containing protein [Treponema sp.]|nr:PilZ domain-containing protein [Treponema sp.]